MVSDASLNKAFRNAWILVALAAVFVVLVAWFVFRTNDPSHEPRWDMGGDRFVPASSNHAEGYYSPVEAPAKESEQ